VELLLDRWMRKGGHTTGGGAYHGHAHVAVKPPKAKGVMVDRKKSTYAGAKPKPTKPWYPLANHGNQVEAYAGMSIGYPYKVKSIWMGGRTNSYYTMFRPHPVRKTHEVVPLIVMMDPFMNEQSMNSDYVLPDATYLQAFGSMHGHAMTTSKNDGIRVPVVGSYGKDHYYQPIEPDCRELSQICVDLGIKMGFPNFGKGGLGEHDLNNAWEFWNDYYSGGDYEGGLSGDNLELAGKFENPAKSVVGDYQNHAGKGIIHAYFNKAAAKKNSLTGKHFDGLPQARGVLDGAENPIPAGDYPYMIGTYKDVLHTQARTAQNLVLMSMRPENGVEMNPATAAELGVQTGDWVKVTGQSGDEMLGRAVVTNTIRPGYVEVAHGWGHWELGARDIEIEGHEGGGIKGDPRVGAGFRYNEVVQADPAQTGDPDTIGCPSDPIGAGNQTYGYSVKIEKV
jgi:anaerobic selenocysteine-containing dehydrogenase